MVCINIVFCPATFQRLINRVISGSTGCEAYIDDFVLHSDSWNSLMQVQGALFDRRRAARLTVNLAKSEFCQATVQYQCRRSRSD